MSEGNQMPPLPNASLLNDTCSTDDPVKRKSVMIETYTEGIGHEKCDNTQKCINTVLRCTILPKKKFVDEGDQFGRFDKPDFRDEKSWISIMYKKIEGLDMMTDRMKCRIWMTYRKKIKEQFSLHRSAVTLKIQKSFIAGKCKQCECSFFDIFDDYLTLCQSNRTQEVHK